MNPQAIADAIRSEVAAIDPTLPVVIETVPERDPWTLAITVAVLLGVALFAAWFPSRRALGVDPLIALKQE
jgi:ABC-type antimicrobial peptide transport system permease subunit